MKNLKKALCLAIVAIAFSSCASIFTKSSYPVAIDSTPQGATITVTNKKGKDVFIGETPAIIKLKSSAGFFSKAEYTVRISLPGYQEHVATIGADIEGWYFANILLGGLIGMLIVDPATGAMWTLDTEQVKVKLKPTETSSLQILDINDISEDMKKHLVKIN